MLKDLFHNTVKSIILAFKVTYIAKRLSVVLDYDQYVMIILSHVVLKYFLYNTS